MHILAHRSIVRASALCGVFMLTALGCNKKADNTSNFTSAINTYYNAHPACLWNDEIKFPLQVATSDASKTAPYDALVDQGLLARTTVEKKKLIVLSQQANNYDLSDKGRSAWTADASQPGFGNFCYGHRKVSNIVSSTPTTDQPGATTQISYQFTFSDAPGWASAAETQNAFPQLHTDLAGPQTGQATLANTTNGWQVSSTPDSGHHSAPATAADGKVVQ
ncbi:hypothetical protein [Granulicella arctica]|uniref:hypothetical protein n=1 Tax=Granulicella arctica TaxID=940613 RepID=UPI0021DFB355|nr:hypothetical protein [Granulicella arctica]